MLQWRKRRTGDYSLDYDALESMISEVLDSFEDANLDFSGKVDVTFRISLDEEGFIRLNEFGILPAVSETKKPRTRPVAELIDLGKELLVVFEAPDAMEDGLAAKLAGNFLIISGATSKKIVKRIKLPCTVDGKTLKSSFNNGVLETRLVKIPEENSALLGT